MAYSRNITWDDGTEEFLGNMERCSGLLDKNGKLSHLFYAIWQGGGFCNETLDAKVWNISVPPEQRVKVRGERDMEGNTKDFLTTNPL